jgi:1-deoxy-D-xylulose-5-phosphate reductoisomerase
VKRVSVFGATGSVGVQTLDLIARNSDLFSVSVLTGGANVALLAQQAKTFRPEYVVIADERLLPQLRTALDGTGIRASGGRQALLEAASVPVDWVMSAVVGFAGLEISLISATVTPVLALANKESLVCGSHLLLDICAAHGTRLLPVDSEHSAIFQLLQGENTKDIERVIITASGGPFRNMSRSEMERVTPDQAAAHPNWSMGRRISIDSASMFNKAMELIEAKVLFGIGSDQLEVLVHPQSLVHSLVGYCDGALLAHVGPPDMRAAIGYALFWPDRGDLPIARLDLGKIGQLDFNPPDTDRFPSLRLALDTMRIGGTAGAVFNAAKEATLDLFLDRKIGFLDMANFTEQAMTAYSDKVSKMTPTLDNVIETDQDVRRFISEILPVAVTH